MVLQKQIKLNDYYVKKNGNTISQDGNNVTATNKNVATDGSGNVIFEEKNNHSHNQYTEKSAQSNDITSDTGSTSKYPTVKAVEDYAQPKGDYVKKNGNTISQDGNNVTAANKNVATDGSGNVIFEDKQTIDNTITSSSNNPVKSSAIYNALLGKQDIILDSYVDVFEMGIFFNNGNSIQLLDDKISYDYADTGKVFILKDNRYEEIATKNEDNSNLLLANGNTIAQSSFISKGSTGDIQLANGSTTPTTSFATSGHDHDSTYIPLSARKATVTSGDTTGVPTGDAVQKAIDATLDNIITQLRS